MPKGWIPIAFALAVAATVAVWLVSADSEDNAASDASPTAGSPETFSEEGRAPDDQLIRRCHWQGARQPAESAIRQAFVDSESGDIRLLLAQNAVRPGEVLSVAVANDSDSSVQYGTFSHVETAAGEKVQIRGPYGFRAVGLSAAPSGIGPCVTLPVPSSTPPGDYVAVVADVRVAGQSEDLRAPFRVAGRPISKPEWERDLMEAARNNRS